MRRYPGSACVETFVPVPRAVVWRTSSGIASASKTRETSRQYPRRSPVKEVQCRHRLRPLGRSVDGDRRQTGDDCRRLHEADDNRQSCTTFPNWWYTLQLFYLLTSSRK